jgi:spermidine/putrescine-binding protein
MNETNQYSRRIFLQRSLGLGAALVVGPTLLAACGSDDESTPSGDTPSAIASGSDTVRVLTWEGYYDPEAYAPLAAKGIRVEPIAMTDDNVDPINRAGQYDIAMTNVGIFPNFIDAGLLHPLDLALIPNFQQHLDAPSIYSSPEGPPEPEVKDGKAYGLPYAWGTLGVSYRLNAGPGEPQRLDDLLQPEYEGQLGMVNDPAQVISMVSRSLGLGGTDPFGRSPAPLHLTEEELEQVFTKLDEYKAQARTIYPGYGALVTAYARGEIIAAFPDWAPDAVAATEGGTPVNVTFPPDASRTYIDSWFISSRVTPTLQMYEFLNQSLAPDTQYAVGKALTIAVTNGQAMSRLVEEGPAWSVYADPEQVLTAAPYVVNPPATPGEYVSLGEMLTRWEQFTA